MTDPPSATATGGQTPSSASSSIARSTDEGVVTKPVELFAEMELFRLLDQFFDKALFYLAAGYESVHVREEVAVA